MLTIIYSMRGVEANMSIFGRSEIINKLKHNITGSLTETSPFDQLTVHAEKVKETVMALIEEIFEYSQGNETHGGDVSKLEFEADKTKQKFRQELPRSDLLMPVARSDLLSLLWNQDEIADTAQDAAELLPMLKLNTELPEQYKTSLGTLAETLEIAIQEYSVLVKDATGLIKGTDSSKKKQDELEDSIERINEFEHEGDKTTRNAIKSTYNNKTLGDIEKYHLIQVILKINNILDHIENASNFIRIMTIK